MKAIVKRFSLVITIVLTVSTLFATTAFAATTYLYSFKSNFKTEKDKVSLGFQVFLFLCKFVALYAHIH